MASYFIRERARERVLYKAVRPEPVEGSTRSGVRIVMYTKSKPPGVARQLVTFSCFAKKK
jgi:hypothetical protein